MHSENDIIPINQHNGGKPMRKWKKAGTIGLIAVMLCVSGAGCKKKATPERLFKVWPRMVRRLSLSRER